MPQFFYKSSAPPPPGCHPVRKQRGFTLIELILVVLMLFVLYAVFSPIFIHPPHPKQRPRCASNLKQIGLAMLMYAQDYDGVTVRNYYGPSGEASDPATGAYKWMDAIQPYVKNPAIFNCPDDERRNRYIPSAQLAGPSKAYYGNYGINNVSFLSGDAWTPPIGVPMTKIVKPAETVWASDTSGDYQIASLSGLQRVVESANPPRFLSVRARHSEGANALYCDGHVRWNKLDRLAEPTADGKAHRWFSIEDD